MYPFGSAFRNKVVFSEQVEQAGLRGVDFQFSACHLRKEQKYGWCFAVVVVFLGPSSERACEDALPLAGDVGSHTQLHLRGEYAAEFGNELVVAIRCFNKYLGLMLAGDSSLHFAELGGACPGLHGEVSGKGERLSVEPRCHQRQQDAGGADERIHSVAQLLGPGHGKSSGVGHGRTSGLAHHGHVISLSHRLKHGGHIGGVGVLVEHAEGERVNVDVAAAPLEETACAADILHNEMLHRACHLYAVGGHYLCRVGVTQRHRQEIERRVMWVGYAHNNLQM